MANRINLMCIEDLVADNSTTIQFSVSKKDLEKLEIYDENDMLIKERLKEYPNAEFVNISFDYTLYGDFYKEDPIIFCCLKSKTITDTDLAYFDNCYMSEQTMNEFKAVAIRKEPIQTAKHIVISELAYDLYKSDWIRRYVKPEQERENICDYYAYVEETKRNNVDNDDDTTILSYAEWQEEHGFNGNRYSSYEEFLECEYSDVEFMLKLFNDNSSLVSAYIDDTL